MGLIKNIFFITFFVIIGTTFTSNFYLSPALSAGKVQDYGGEDDVENPFEGNAEAIAEGYEKFNQRCSYCHGMRGVGAKGPPLTIGSSIGLPAIIKNWLFLTEEIFKLFSLVKEIKVEFCNLS